jgi:integrase
LDYRFTTDVCPVAIEVRMGSDNKPRYLVRIESVDPITGDRKRIRAGQFTNRKAAERAEAEALIKRDRGTLLTADITTVSVLLDEWLAHKTAEISANSRTDYEGVVRNHLKPALGSIRVQLLTAQRIQAQYSKWRADGLSPHVIRGCHLRLSAALDYAVRMKLLMSNPARDVRPPRLDRSKFAHWTVAEARAFLGAVDTHHQEWRDADASRYLLPRVLWDLLLREGMRRGEALGLRWRDINWERGTAHIVQTVSYDKGSGGAAKIQSRAKTRAGERTVRLSDETLARLKQRQQDWRLQRLASERWQDTDLVVCTVDGGPINPSNVGRAFRSIVQRSKVDGNPLRLIKVHELRHTSATLLLLGGVPAKVVSEKLGHASIAITLDTYSHVLPDMQEEAALVMSRLLADDEPQRSVD